MVILRTLFLHLFVMLLVSFRVHAQDTRAIPEAPAPYAAGQSYGPAPVQQPAPVRRPLVGEILGWVIGASVGTAVTYGLSAVMANTGSDESIVAPLFGIGGMNLLLTVPAAVYFGGKLAGGGGRFGYTLLGNLVGILPGALMLAVGIQDLSGDGTFLIGGPVMMLLGGLIGSILGYELSATDPEPPPRNRFAIAPMLAPRASYGFVAGVSGAF